MNLSGGPIRRPTRKTELRFGAGSVRMGAGETVRRNHGPHRCAGGHHRAVHTTVA